MVLSADWTLWVLTTVVQALVVYLFVVKGLFRKFLLFNFYLMLCVALSISRWVFLYHFGFGSVEYLYFYYFSDALLTLFFFLGVCELGAHLVGAKLPRNKIVAWCGAALFLTACFSLAAVSWSIDFRATTRFVIELSTNIFFVGCLAVALLWIWNLCNDSQDRIAARLVNVLTIYCSLFFLIYCGHNIDRHVYDFTNLYLMDGAWLPLGCGFALASNGSHE